MGFETILAVFVSPCPLYLDKMAEAGGVRGALICWRSGSPFLLFFVFLFSFLFCSSHMTHY
jgi:hypothetical protein